MSRPSALLSAGSVKRSRATNVSHRTGGNLEAGHLYFPSFVREEEEEGGKGGTTNTSMASHPCRENSEEEREEGTKEEKRRSGSVTVNEEEKEKHFGDKSRFLPEVIDPNRVTIV